MVLPQSAVSDLLEVLRTGEAVDLIRESVRTVLQELIEAEAAESIGATRYERSESRTNERNGSRPRMLATKAGDIDLRIPKLAKGSFFPLILEPRRRIDRALYAVVMEAYVAGVCTRSVDDLVAALGIDSGIFPRPHWPKIWSTNPLERVSKEIKRRARVVGIFPDEPAVFRLVGAILADMHDEWQSGERRYLAEGSMAQLNPTSDTDTTAVIDSGA
jgi:transposase-like protein